MARTAVLSVATSVAAAMATHGSTTATATEHSMAIHGYQRRMPRHSTAIATAILPRQVPWQYAAIATVLHGNHHGNFHGRQSTAISMVTHSIPRPSAAIATAILQYAETATELHGDRHGFPRAGVSVGMSMDVTVGMSVDVSVGVSAGLSVGVSVGASWVCPWALPWVLP